MLDVNCSAPVELSQKCNDIYRQCSSQGALSALHQKRGLSSFKPVAFHISDIKMIAFV
jgi:hypothetical protein